MSLLLPALGAPGSWEMLGVFLCPKAGMEQALLCPAPAWGRFPGNCARSQLSLLGLAVFWGSREGAEIPPGLQHGLAGAESPVLLGGLINISEVSEGLPGGLGPFPAVQEGTGCFSCAW